MAGLRLSFREREAIQRGDQAGLPAAEIAAVLGRDASTVWRELRRGGGRGRYRAVDAHERAARLARRPQPFKLTGALAAVVGGLLAELWSPRQIERWLPQEYPDDDGMRVSHETIYKSLFVQGRGELRRELARHLRTHRASRRPRGTAQRRGRLVGMVAISARPAEAADRAVPGHWEGDLLLGGRGKGAVVVLVERTTRFCLLAPLPGRHGAAQTRERLTEMVGRLPQQLWRSLTWDQGKEMAEHATFSVETGVAVYFCDPHSPWQRGSNEQTNKLLRQWWPKGSDMRDLTQADCDAVAAKLNARPRETLEWQTPAKALNNILIATAA
jgi:transposase, IS30 family